SSEVWPPSTLSIMRFNRLAGIPRWLISSLTIARNSSSSLAPKAAVENLERVTGKSRHDYDLFEINEAFSSGACALAKTLELDADKINVNGGAIALGHPIGGSGARILTTLVYALKQRGLKSGVATLCLGGGNAVATAIELVD
ncbi:MAG TPA: acetyl-CoA C-acyltransferase, partial [Planctomycetes bacterium]|nr:acetyl-CoA C-acyltransferase [Planctomycetota bacterium]